MIRALFILLLSGLSCLLFSSAVFVTTPPPDPETFSKLFIETIKKNDRELYMNTFQFTDADIEWIMNTCLASAYLSENDRADIQSEFNERVEIKNNLNEELQENFADIQSWVENDTINLNTIEIIDFYYKLEIKKRFPFYALDYVNLFIKHETKFYRININKVAFINNQWKYGEILGIKEVDKNLNSLHNILDDDVYGDLNYAAADTFTVDTTMVVEPYYENDDYYYPSLSNKQDKKAARIQKKIDALYEQQNKIIYKQQ